MPRMTGAEIVVRLLERQGIGVVAGIPGGMNLPLYDALAQAGTIRHVLARHEQGAGFIAQGMARATGSPAVCLTTSGPGATNVLTAIADARLDSVPVVCITGQVPTRLIGTDAFQEVDTYGLSLPITKHNFLVRSTAELLEAVPEAFRIAASGRPGPVVVDIPKDVQTGSLEIDGWPAPGASDPIPAPDPGRLAAAAALIAASRRPVLCLGGGTIRSGAAAAVRLAEKASIPVAMTLMGLGAVPSDHPLAMGLFGMHGARCTNLALDECDLLIAAGLRFDDRATGAAASFCPNARIIHIDIDAAEIGKIKRADVAVAGDAGAALAGLLPLVPADTRAEWGLRVADLRRRLPLSTPGAGDPRTPYGLILRTAELAGPEAVVTTDVGQHQMWAAQAYPHRLPRHWLTSGGLGTMGFGLPAAIGAALARPDRTVVCFSGDGSLLMNVQELATAAEENVNVKVIVFDNGSLGLVRQQQDLFYGRRRIASEFAAAADYPALARAFGVRACDLAEGDPDEVLADGLSGPGPCLIRAPIPGCDYVFPMVPPGAANREMIGGETNVRTIVR